WVGCCGMRLHKSFSMFSSTLLNSGAPAIATLSLRDALPISEQPEILAVMRETYEIAEDVEVAQVFDFRPLQESNTWATSTSSAIDRKSTRLNSSHRTTSYAVFCLKKKKASPTNCVSQFARQV